jgi:hypothetical protein
MSDDRKYHDGIVKSLGNIETGLELVADLLKARLPPPKVGKEEKKILRLCDKKNTSEEIAKKTHKSENNVNVMLTDLRDKALIRSVKIEGRVVYERI